MGAVPVGDRLKYSIGTLRRLAHLTLVSNFFQSILDK